ncbi:hypothetical protein [Patulibacter sp.]|uniref:hypothetical protein n=1 Tax=Patulibacter sp. TaxID=1912859 RepID=UPI00271F9A61|nr:hypothetical protein [Patulibacter sp.]MDO9407849.1 hypothetical protein [Patulibacter sp.]
MSSQGPQSRTPGRSSGRAPDEQQLVELLHRIDDAQHQIDQLFDVLRDLAVSVRDRPRRQVVPRTRPASPAVRANGHGPTNGSRTANGHGSHTGEMRGWGH